MASKKQKAAIFNNLLVSRPTQQLLFGEEVQTPLGEGFFPPIYRDYAGFCRTLREAQEEGALGYDLEFQGKRPSIVGIASKRSAASLESDPFLIEEIYDSGLPLVGHSVIDADKPVTDSVLGYRTELSRWEDTLIYFYLLHQHYAKVDDRSDVGESSGESGSIGLFDLFTTTAHYVLLPCWKHCRGKYCSGPCPVHDPFGYNAVDSWAPLIAWYEMREQYRKHFPSNFAYQHKAELAEICHQMRENGVQLDMAKAEEISNEIETKRTQLAEKLPFNPGSPKQVTDYFASCGITLESASRDNVLAGLRSAAEQHGYELEEIDEEGPEVLQHLKAVYDWKLAGKGIKSWTDEKYRDKLNKVHPRFIVCSTATGRLSSSSPNFQNVPANGNMAKVREVIVPSSEGYKLLGADYSQMEARIVYKESGYPPMEGDPFLVVVSQTGDLFTAPAAQRGVSVRKFAKPIVHGINYFLGMHAYRQQDLRSGYFKKLLNQDALYVFKDWEYCGMQMCITGNRLSQMIFGDDTPEHRREAIKVHLAYLEKYSKVHEWHRKVTREIELTGRVARKTGFFLELSKDPNDAMKKAAAFFGQGYGGDFCQGAMRAFFRKYGIVPLLQIHDENIFEVPVSWDDEECWDFIKLMAEPNDAYPGFACPIEAKQGPRWGTMQPLVITF